MTQTTADKARHILRYPNSHSSFVSAAASKVLAMKDEPVPPKTTVSDHSIDCGWQLDQYDHECTCGWQETVHLLSSPRNAERMLRAKKQLDAGGQNR